jgi:hypothetical protein
MASIHTVAQRIQHRGYEKARIERDRLARLQINRYAYVSLSFAPY